MPIQDGGGRLRSGAVRLFILFALAGCERPGDPLGRQIYNSGKGQQGRVAYTQGPGWLARGSFGCATCHGDEGQGRFVQAGLAAGAAPPLTADALRARAYDEARLRRAITDGVAADGREMSYYMPRWRLGERELQALVDHLATL